MQQLFAHAGHHHMYGDTSTNDGLIAFSIFFLLVITLAAYALQAYLLGKIFQKANEKAWKAWVPIYNNWVMLELGGQRGWWAVLALIPLVNIVSLVFIYIAMYDIGLKLRKDGVFVLIAIFLPLVWYAWLAFDGSTWQGRAAHKKA